MSSEIIVSEKYLEAVKVHKNILANVQVAQDAIWELGNDLKKMRDDKFYKEFGYDNFEDYSKNAIGFSRSQAYKYISIVENIPDNFVSPGETKHIQMSCLYLLSTLSESDREEITQNNDVAEMSKRELEEKIKEIKMLNKEKSELAALNESLKESNESLRANSDKQSEVIEELEVKVEELENRPIDVAVADNSHEIENMRKAMAKMGADEERKYRQLEEDSIKSERKLHQEYQAKIQEYEEKLKSASAPAEITDDKEVFKAYLANTIDATKRLLDYVGKHPNELYTAKIKSFFETTLNEIGG